MYITCEQCSTTFRLDETRLKPSGSKVRCSQCGNLFIARPPASADADQVASTRVRPAAAKAVEPPPPPPEDTFDQELDGIDLAELDSILERDRSGEDSISNDVQGDYSGVKSVEEAEELDERDLDLDFESALALDDDQSADIQMEARQDESEELDLDMDFELDGGSDLQRPTQDQAKGVGQGDSGLGEDIDTVLDDFENVLGQPEEVATGSGLSEEVADEDLSSDLDLDLEEESAGPELKDREPELSLADSGDKEAETLADDLDLGDLDAVLDDKALLSDSEDEHDELELSLDDGDTLGLDKEPVSELAGGQVPADVAHDDEFDLTDLDELLDVDEEQEQAQAPESDEEIAFSPDEVRDLDVESEPAPGLEKEDGEPAEAVVSGAADDDLDLSGFDALLDEDLETEKPEPENLELSLDDQAGLDLAEEPALEMEAEAEPADSRPVADLQGDDLDLGGLDALLDEVDEQAEQSGPEELELTLDDESEQAPPAVAGADEKADKDAVELEDLEFELDAEFEDKPVSKGVPEDQTEASSEADEELDLSDIEKMLEDDTLVPEPTQQAGDLDLDLVGGAEKWADEAADDLGATADGEIDLSEIEAAIDSADEDIDTGIEDDFELELDLEPHEEAKEEQGDELDFKLEMESDSSSPDQEAMEEATDEIDLSDLDLSIDEEKPEADSEIINAGDIELEFQIEEEAATTIIDSAETLAGSQTTAAFREPTVAAADDDSAMIQEAFAPQPVVEKAVEKSAPVRKKKKGTSKSDIAN